MFYSHVGYRYGPDADNKYNPPGKDSGDCTRFLWNFHGGRGPGTRDAAAAHRFRLKQDKMPGMEQKYGFCRQGRIEIRIIEQPEFFKQGAVKE